MNEHFQMPVVFRNWAWVLVGVGILSLAGGFWVSPVHTWISLHTANIYFVTAALFGLFILAVSHAASAAWLSPYKSVAESMTSYLIPGGVFLVLGLLGGGHTLFHWTHYTDLKTPYLNMPFFLGRAVAYLLVWIAFAAYIVRRSRMFPEPNVRASVWCLIAFAFTFSFSSFDWLMSIEPHWYSTIYALYCFSGFFVAGTAILTIAVFVLDRYGYLKNVLTENHYHDLGKLLFAFSTFWAYMWLSQYLLIWYTNMPEETVYYTLRTHHDWDWLFYFNLLINWIIPFFVLMPREMKRSPEVLLRVAIMLLIGRWLDLFLLIAPKVFESAKITQPSIGWIEVGVGLGMGGAFALLCARSLSQHRVVAKEDVFFEEGVHLVQ